jgi:hypothetical protein
MSDNQSDNSSTWDTSSPVETIPVTLEDGEWAVLLHNHIKETCLIETYETFEEALVQGKTEAEALLLAMRNEAVNEVLYQTINKEAIERVSKAIAAISVDRLIEHNLAAAQEPISFRKIWVTFQKEGMHLYPAAATDPKLATGQWDDVSFLASPHRHIFHFRVAIEVRHDDRDIEFIQFKRWLERLYANGTLNLDHKSCEMISDDLFAKITERWPGRLIEIDVSEDGENGSNTVYPA